MPKKNSVPKAPEIIDRQEDRKPFVIIIQGAPVLASLNREYTWKHQEWESQCASVRAGFHKKTSRSNKNGKDYEYTNWYHETGTGLKSVGKEEPDYIKFYPPEPKPAHSFKAQEYEGHLILPQKDYEANQTVFKDCLSFCMGDCKNLTHPLYTNPDKALKDSVRAPGAISGRSQISGGTEKEDLCWNDGDCDTCEHNDECPVGPEEEE